MRSNSHVLRVDGETPRVVLGVIDPRTGVMVAGTVFLSVYFAGQILNAFTEECIFRGILLPQFMRRMSFWKANLAQASLFAVAHLVWPMSSWVLGRATLPEALAEAGLLLVFTAVGGLIFGYSYYRTNNLWTPLLAHLIDNRCGSSFTSKRRRASMQKPTLRSLRVWAFCRWCSLRGLSRNRRESPR